MMIRLAVVTTRSWVREELQSVSNVRVSSFVNENDVDMTCFDGVWRPAIPRMFEYFNTPLPGLNALLCLDEAGLLLAPIIHKPKNGDKVFCKIIDVKRDNLMAGVRFWPWCEGLDSGFDVIVHEPVNIRAEWRCYVRRISNNIFHVSIPSLYLMDGMSYYDGVDNSVEWNRRELIVNELLGEVRQLCARAAWVLDWSCSNAWVVDVGLSNEKKLGVIEVNSPSSSAWYGVNTSHVVNSIISARNKKQAKRLV